MAKRDELLARIDADIARLDQLANYINETPNNITVTERLATERIQLAQMRNYVTADADAPVKPEKPKRGRKKKHTGLPIGDDGV